MTRHSSFTLLLLALSLAACSNKLPAEDGTQTFDYLQLPPGKSIDSGQLCEHLKVTATLNDNVITLESGAGSYHIKNELDDGASELIAGDFWGNGQCFIAVMNARSDVNESYDVYEITASSPPYKVPSIPTIINPDFANGVVISSYRDAARWHKEKLCYPPGKSPYICEKSDAVNDTLERVIRCDSIGACDRASLMVVVSGLPATATVSQSKAVIFMPSADGQMRPQRSYLIRGDRLNLLDHRDLDDAAYYQFEFKGRKTTVGWIDASAVTLDHRD
ncbi:hypothetical protein IP90_00807 [Luteimonas cucumeris]|uniref:SH3 domain-containing protein n=1 Tax=Luteimonas cucumeris TaxID=985012 RepID=A0A562LB26_9GAMM|nr:hypothetical protein [Luteimonas cucumeris]TWI04674.1 hypothetical protein IP90_00807 [Luteimonas cucumeris]